MSRIRGVYARSGPSSKVSTTYLVGSGTVVGGGAAAAVAGAGRPGVDGWAGDFPAATTTVPITALTSIRTAQPTMRFPVRVKRNCMFPQGGWVVHCLRVTLKHL